MNNWRLLEAEIVSCLRLQGCHLDETILGDRITLSHVNITELAKVLSDHGVTVPQPIKVTT